LSQAPCGLAKGCRAANGIIDVLIVRHFSSFSPSQI
jgi:hypothetical protein